MSTRWGWSDSPGDRFCGPINYELQEAGSGSLLTYNQTSHELWYTLPADQTSYETIFTARVVATLTDWPAVPTIDLLVPVQVLQPEVPEVIVEEEPIVEEEECEVEKVVLADGSSKIASLFTVPAIPYSHTIRIPQYWP